MNLSHALPFAAFAFIIASSASMGIPGFSGFVAEITILIGVWKTYPIAVWITGAGMVLVAAFTLRALMKSFFGEVRMQTGRVSTDADWNEQSITLAESAALVADVRHACGRTLSQISARPHHAGSGSDEISKMRSLTSTMSYLELLRLASPEAVVVIGASSCSRLGW